MTSSTVGGTVEATAGPEGVEVEITTETSGDDADIGGVLTGGGTNGEETAEETVVLGDGPADLGELDGTRGGFGTPSTTAPSEPEMASDEDTSEAPEPAPVPEAPAEAPDSITTVGGTVEATAGPEGVEVEITTETSGDDADIGGVLTGGGTNGEETAEETVVLGDGPADLGDLDGPRVGFGSEPAPDLSFGGGDWTPRPAVEDLWTESDAPDPLDEMEITPPAIMGEVITDTGLEVTAAAGPEGVSTGVETAGEGDPFGGFTVAASNGDVTEVQTGMFDGFPMVPFVEGQEEDADQTGGFELDGFFG